MAVGAELASSGAGVSSLGNTGSWAASEVIELVCAPPVLCTMPVRGSGVAVESDETVVDDGEVDSDGEVDVDDELAKRLEVLSLSVAAEADELDGSEDVELDDALESDVSASATPGMVATADPTPSATANAPTRPMYLT